MTRFEVVDAFTGKTVFKSSQVRPMGELGELKTTCRLDFSSLGMEAAAKPLVCRVRAYSGKELAAESEVFPIGPKVYDGAADFVLNYMRQQRCGWNPFIKDSCHVHDAIIVGHPDPAKDSPHLDGGYAAFGHVTSGMEVVDAICEDTPVTDDNGTVPFSYQPVITSIKVID